MINPTINQRSTLDFTKPVSIIFSPHLFSAEFEGSRSRITIESFRKKLFRLRVIVREFSSKNFEG